MIRYPEVMAIIRTVSIVLALLVATAPGCSPSERMHKVDPLVQESAPEPKPEAEPEPQAETTLDTPADEARQPEMRILIFTKTAGYRHASIPVGIHTLRQLGTQYGFGVEATEDATTFDDDTLANFDVVVFLNTTGDVLDDEQQAAFEQYIHHGGGFVGIHSATDTEYDWPWYGRLVGAWFAGHPPIQDAVVDVIDRTHPATQHLPPLWHRNDEWYNFRAQPKGVRVLATLDVDSYLGSTQDPHPICWCHNFEGGRAFYTEGGHTTESYAEKDFQRHLVGGIYWAAGRDKVPEPRQKP